MCLITDQETEVFVLVKHLFFTQVKFPKQLIRSYIPTNRLLPVPAHKLSDFSKSCAEDASAVREIFKRLAAEKNESQAEFLSRGIKKSFKDVLNMVERIFGA